MLGKITSVIGDSGVVRRVLTLPNESLVVLPEWLLRSALYGVDSGVATRFTRHSNLRANRAYHC